MWCRPSWTVYRSPCSFIPCGLRSTHSNCGKQGTTSNITSSPDCTNSTRNPGSLSLSLSNFLRLPFSSRLIRPRAAHVVSVFRTEESERRDEHLHNKISKLATFITPEHLEIDSQYVNEELWERARIGTAVFPSAASFFLFSCTGHSLSSSSQSWQASTTSFRRVRSSCVY
jgi:hypothetical protein